MIYSTQCLIYQQNLGKEVGHSLHTENVHTLQSILTVYCKNSMIVQAILNTSRDDAEGENDEILTAVRCQ